MTSSIGSTILGYPRIGPRRELKRALEKYWAAASGESELRAVARELCARTWRELSAAGLDSVPGNTFSYYDHVLDTATMLGAVPARFRALGLGPLDTYFAMARGAGRTAPLELTKWFDTNYHYLVPEIGPDTEFTLADHTPVTDYLEASTLGVPTRPVLLGPVTFLLLAKPAAGAPEDFRPLDRLADVLPAYRRLLRELHAAGADWVQFDEPALAADRTESELDAVRTAYAALGELGNRPSILVAGYFGDLDGAIDVLAAAPVEGLAVDLVSSPSTVDRVAEQPGLADKTLVAGVIDGRNVWRTNLDAALTTVTTLRESARDVAVSTSCSLLHVPYDVEAEPSLDPEVRPHLAFAVQKVREVVTLGRALTNGRASVGAAFEASRAARAVTGRTYNHRVRARLEMVRPAHIRRPDYETRRRLQDNALRLPPLPTTTVGSFPQTADLRKTRAAWRRGDVSTEQYRERMREEIRDIVRLQEDVGLDVLVHGEPERGDMVQYVAEHLDGFATTEHGWVQSYGSRCVRPPILFGDVSRPAPFTVEWARYGQSLTDKPVKGMLTGPVTMLAWSFVRNDQSAADTAAQVALALRDEVRDLERAGIGVIQVDEPALRELLPLRRRDRRDYLCWAVESFRLATSGVADVTQIHTHLCYAEFGDVLDAIVALEADVTSIEAARSHMEVLDDLAAVGFARGVGPGVYDIHSPRVPGAAEIARLLAEAMESVPVGRLWVNPDCGLKTRGYAETEEALRAMVEGAQTARRSLR
ncbi:5-methyltetrahydropteroyltriglutamate--homocysteine S-methyltransferase [Saccharomonospora sp. CUA-673]|uniref:5-methyltetrahydropteroyltriglutamate-- homocysteine S-methyltransferase n=1 Tax=Saccharomonospora sp. CUA-673 TaxID=1904969 RepID=UPI000962466C|nr:5-methyltetrahydropteroyltriglutamate--homocysteine S-methyltransferase [Saccharomonospora sp. CUA-673]OLT48957.1 5-methyltetrahydropteroyltriglutamate--homocysteine S-methyltransferase [Saccharomonospora sp. CUA-673]